MSLPPRITPASVLRVLVIEDEPRLRDVLIDELPRMGYQGVGASTAEKALRLLSDESESPFDIVTLDLNLPVLDGMTFLEQFRKKWPDTPVIIMTGFGDLDAAKTAIDHNVTSFLTKPCGLGEFERALNKAKRTLIDRFHDALEEPTQAPPAVVQSGTADGKQSPATEAVDQPRDLAAIERQAILDALERHQGNRTAAAKELGISRRTLYNRLAEYGEE